jgi:hypothetical protein
MKGKFLSSVFKSFSKSRLFNGLRAKKIKKIRSRLTRVSGCRSEPVKQRANSIGRSARRARLNESSIAIVPRLSGFGKKMLEALPIFLNRAIPPSNGCFAVPREPRPTSSTRSRLEACKLRGPPAGVQSRLRLASNHDRHREHKRSDPGERRARPATPGSPRRPSASSR